MNALEREIAGIIAHDGPISVERYMQICLQHPVHGYYIARDPLGRGGDFTTSPEISQMFGELIGLFMAQGWIDLGGPKPVQLVELGPGRGSLMADFLRAARKAPAFYEALELTMVETSSVLIEKQRQALAPFDLAKNWVDRWPARGAGPETGGEGPLLLVANEFFDALPVRQYTRKDGAWRERLVGLDDAGRLAFGVAREDDALIAREAPEGAVLEVAAAARRIVTEIAAHIQTHGGLALIIDYGAAGVGVGDTLQAMRAHGYVDPLVDPGEADLTVHVDFAALARSARSAGAAVYGPLTQGEFLNRLGVEQRAAALARAAGPDRAGEVESALERLRDETSPKAMGALFKVLCVARRGAPVPPGFEGPDA